MNEVNFTPINKTASMVIGKGFKYESRKRIQNKESATPLQMKQASYGEKNQKKYIELTGFKFGRFIVLGRYANGKGWVVRCVCGTYCIRQAKAIKNPKNTQDRCEECRHLAYLKRSEVKRRTGIDVDITQF